MRFNTAVPSWSALWSGSWAGSASVWAHCRVGWVSRCKAALCCVGQSDRVDGRGHVLVAPRGLDEAGGSVRQPGREIRAIRPRQSARRYGDLRLSRSAATAGRGPWAWGRCSERNSASNPNRSAAASPYRLALW